MKEIKNFEVSSISLWDQNPRNDRGFILSEDEKTEFEIITEMLKRPKLKSSLPGLLDDLYEKGYIQEPIIIYQKIDDNGEITNQAYDGNRRLLLLKIIKHQDLLSSSNLDVDKISHIAKNIKTVNAIYYKNDEKNDALDHVKSRHNGLDDGHGQLPWDSDNKANIDVLMGEANFSIGNKIIDFYKSHSEDPRFSFVYEKIVNKPDKTTLDRIFKSSAVSKNIFNLKSKNDYNLDSPYQQEKMNEVLQHFYEKTSGKVSDVYSKAQIESQFQDIKPIQVEKYYGGEDIFSVSKKKERKNNKYTSNVKLFNWRRRAFDFSDTKLKRILKLSLDRYDGRFLYNLNDFDKMIVFMIYRTISELAIREFMKYFIENQNAFNINHQGLDKYVKSMNTGDDVSVFTAGKIAAVINLSNNIKDSEKLKQVEDQIKYLKRKNLNNFESKKLIAFIDNIHSTVHGNSKSTDTLLEEYDTHVVNLLELINKISK